MEQEFSTKEEQSVGIIEFLTAGKQIPAITKYLLTDFIVNEIDKSEKVVSLTKKPSLDNVPKITYQPNFQISQQHKEKITGVLG